MAVPVSALQQIAPSAVIELFQLELNAAQHGVNETYYFHAGVNATGSNGDIIWNSQAYMRFPLEAEGFEYSGQGQLPRPKLRISNILGTITALILTLPNGLEGAKVTRIRTLARYIDGVNFPGGTNPYGSPDSTAEFPREIFYIDRTTVETRDVIEFELAAVFDLIGVRAPKRQCVSNVCQWKYRGPECGYAGNAYFNTNNQPVATLALDACGKQLSSCDLRFEQQYRTGSVTTGSNILTLTQASSFSTGDPVTGFGLPAGTTVSSVSGALVTLNQNATATTNVVRTGTLQTDYQTIIVSSATGISPGMTVVGTYLPAGAQVVTVSGTTITLGTPVDPTQFFTALDSTGGRLTGNRTSVLVSSLPGAFTVNRIISSEYVPATARARITNIRHVGISTGKSVNMYNVLDLSIAANYPVRIFSSPLFTWTVYSESAPSAATYTFFATNQTYTFRANANLPFGSYPGVGTYTT